MSSVDDAVPALPTIGQAVPRSEADAALFGELRAVLQRHGALSRFGITLLHEHFAIGDDEILVEECDAVARTLVLQPGKRRDLGRRDTIITNWRLDVSDERSQQIGCCVFDDDVRNHVKRIGECPPAEEQEEPENR